MSQLMVDKVEKKMPLTKITEVELVYRNKLKSTERPTVKSPDDAYRLFLETWDADKIELQEQFRVMLLDRKMVAWAFPPLQQAAFRVAWLILK